MEIERGHIMVVDDEQAIRDLIAVYLRHLGFRVTTLGDGAEAVVFYKDNYKDIDLVSLDLSMPIMGGMECLQRLQQIHPAVKVVILSGSVTHEIDQELHASGVMAVFHKPFDFLTMCDRFVALGSRS